MTAKRAVIAFAILFGGFGWMAQDAEARSADARQGKPSVRSAAAARTAPGANATQRAAGNRGRSLAAAAPGRPTASNRRGGGRTASAMVRGGGGISCVPYARQATGMAISGNGRDWWYNAAGVYDRGSRPETGSVMAFPGSGAMRAGHVAVVERVVSMREVLIHHANWGGPGIRRGSIMRGVSVIDVSPTNDWTQVRVQVGHSNENYGRVYAVHGFIHNRAPGGPMMASHGTQRLNAAEIARLGLEEVAQARPARR